MWRRVPLLMIVAGLVAASGVPAQDAKQTPRYDFLGDPLPAGAVLRLGTQRLHYGDEVSALAWSADSKWLVSTGGNVEKSIVAWDAATGKELRRFGKQGSPVRAMRFTPDGKAVLSMDWKGVLVVWDAASGNELRRFTVGEGSDLACGPGRNSFAALDARNRACVFDLTTGQPLRVFEDHPLSPVTHLLAWSEDAELVVAVDRPNKICLFDAFTGKLRHTLAAAENVLSVAAAPDGNLLATGAVDGSLMLWDASKGKPLRRLRGHRAAVNALSWSPDGKTLASASSDRTVRLWDVVAGHEKLACSGHTGAVLSVAFAPDGRRLASGGDLQEGVVRIWDAETGKELFQHSGHTGWVGTLRPLEDGKTLISAGSDGIIRHWDLATGRCLNSFRGEQSRARAVAIAPGDKLAATGDSERTIRLFELPGGKLVRQFTAHEGAVHALAFSPDGKMLASAGKDQMLYLWEVATGKQLHRLESHAEIVSCFAFTADSRRLFTAGGSAIRIWDVNSGAELRMLPRRVGLVQQIVLSPDEKLLAVIGNDGASAIWEVARGKQIRTLDGISPEGFNAGYCVAFSRDGHSLVGGEINPMFVSSIRIWETATGKVRLEMSPQSGAIASLSLLPDGKKLISGSSDGTILVWDLALRSRETTEFPKALSADEMEAEWRHLCGEDAARSYRALWTLAAVPRQALPRLRNDLQPVPICEPKQLEQWIADLGHDRFAVRNKASVELKKAGELAWPYLRKVLENPPSAEVSARARRLLGKEDILLPSADRLRQSRSLELLERLATPEARELVRALSAGDPKAWLTQEARAMLRRMSDQ